MKYVYLLGVVAILLIAGCTPTGDVVLENDLDDFAKYLTEQGVVMVGAEWCGHCQNQKAMFGDSFQYVTFVDADLQAELAASYGVPGYPTWILPDGTQLIGEQSLDSLKEASGYNEQ